MYFDVHEGYPGLGLSVSGGALVRSPLTSRSGFVDMVIPAVRLKGSA